jgi:phytoene/squalene synthetase
LLSCYRGEQHHDLSAEEVFLTDLVSSDSEPRSGLRTYLDNMMAVMAFDADRRGRLICQAELAAYSNCLATAVTEALHYFIGHDNPPPQSAARYYAATAAHITHMLRDTLEDVEAGYFNIPLEFLQAHAITPHDVSSAPYRTWVQNRINLARAYLSGGRHYLAQVKSLRCRLAGYAYIARFDGVLDAIEREDYRLRAAYPECKRPTTGLRLGWSVLTMALTNRRPRPASPALPAGRMN